MLKKAKMSITQTKCIFVLCMLQIYGRLHSDVFIYCCMQGKTKKIYFYLILTLFVLGLICGLVGVYFIYFPNTTAGSSAEGHVIYIPSKASYEDIKKILEEQKILKNSFTFDKVAKLMKYDKNFKPGKYHIEKNCSNRELIRYLRAGIQDPVNITINSYRSMDSIVNLVGRKLEADTARLRELLMKDDFLTNYGFKKEDIMSMFLADTYKFMWNTDATQFLDRMNSEYKKFWNQERTGLATSMGRSPLEIISLASIVQEETMKNDEMPTVAGVYHNRLLKGMKLQADPTIKFALGRWDLRRISYDDLRVESPYNTYLYEGLPPGPICIPSKLAIEACLKPKSHNYIYFCARDDRSGYHHFTTTYEDHLLYAKQYRESLDERNIHN